MKKRYLVSITYKCLGEHVFCSDIIECEEGPLNIIKAIKESMPDLPAEVDSIIEMKDSPTLINFWEI